MSNRDHWIFRTPLAVFDLETTGLDPFRDRIVQMSIVQIDRGAVTDGWCTLVDPETSIPSEASAVHGITNERVAGAPTFAEVAPEVVGRVGKRGLVAYNGVGFDHEFLAQELSLCGLDLNGRQCLDPLVWIRKFDRYVPGKGRHKLPAACARRGIALRNAHDALADATATWRLLEAIASQIPGSTPRETLRIQSRLATEQERDFKAWLAKQPPLKEAT